jgi:hypothetical protein
MMPTPEGYAGLPVAVVNGKPVVIDNENDPKYNFNALYYQMMKDPKLLKRDELFPIYGKGTPYTSMALGGEVDLTPEEEEAFFKATGKRIKRN